MLDLQTALYTWL